MKFFSAKRSLNQPKAKPRMFCIRSTNQSNRFISVCLFFLYCSRVFISRSYENALSQRPVCYLRSMFFTTNINYQARFFSSLWKRGSWTALTLKKTFGIVIGDVPVSYWPIFFLLPVTFPEVFAKGNSAQFPFPF